MNFYWCDLIFKPNCAHPSCRKYRLHCSILESVVFVFLNFVRKTITLLNCNKLEWIVLIFVFKLCYVYYILCVHLAHLHRATFDFCAGKFVFHRIPKVTSDSHSFLLASKRKVVYFVTHWDVLAAVV